MKQYVVDAFTDKVFSGNPAAVCIMDKWIADDVIMKITRENNLSETAFAVPEGDNYRLRWFTPAGEIDLCGHATLATAFTITNFIDNSKETLSFESLSGILTVKKKDGLFEMNFPAYDLKEVPVTEEMTDAIGAKPLKAYMGRDLLCIMESEELVRNAKPDLSKVMKLDGLLLHLSAKGEKYDSVSRSFAPKCNVPEDPVCGSGHCHIFPYWSKVLGKKELIAYQASERGGILYGKIEEDRVSLSGNAVLYSKAEIFID